MRLYAPAVLPQNSVASKRCLRKINLLVSALYNYASELKAGGLGVFKPRRTLWPDAHESAK